MLLQSLKKLRTFSFHVKTGSKRYGKPESMLLEGASLSDGEQAAAGDLEAAQVIDLHGSDSILV